MNSSQSFAEVTLESISTMLKKMKEQGATLESAIEIIDLALGKIRNQNEVNNG